MPKSWKVAELCFDIGGVLTFVLRVYSYILNLSFQEIRSAIMSFEDTSSSSSGHGNNLIFLAGFVVF